MICFDKQHYRPTGAVTGAAIWLLTVLLSAGAAGFAAADDTPPPPAGAAPPAATVPQPPGAATPAQAPAPAQSPAQGETSAFPEPPPAAAKPGFLSEFGRWWDDGVASFNAKMKDQQGRLDDFNKKSNDATAQAMKNAAEATKDAANAMFRFSTSKVIEIHERCPPAGNGAPDCQTAALNACRGKGFSDGQPVDISTAESCTASLWVSGQNPADGNCPIESTVLRAACQ